MYVSQKLWALYQWQIRPLRKVLLGSKRQARIFGDVNILVILVSRQFATFLHISLKQEMDIYILVILVSKQFATFLHISLKIKDNCFELAHSWLTDSAVVVLFQARIFT